MTGDIIKGYFGDITWTPVHNFFALFCCDFTNHLYICRYGQYQYDSSHSQYSPTKVHYNNDTYSHLESPEKVNSLERNKKNLLRSQINDLDDQVYGNKNIYERQSYDQPPNNYGQSYQQPTSNYNSFSRNAPQFSPLPTYSSHDYQQPDAKLYTPSHSLGINKPYSTTTNTSPKFGGGSFDYDSGKPNNPSAFERMKTTDYKSKPSAHISGNLSGFESSGTSDYGQIGGKPSNFSSFGRVESDFKPSDYKSSSDGYSTSEYATNTYKIPGGYKTDSYKYESYKSTPQPVYSSTSEKYFTSTPNASQLQFSPLDKNSFNSFKNGGDNQYQSSYSSNVEYINEPPVLKNDDTLEQKMLKKSVTQQIIEKKTTQTTRSSKQESSTKNFKFE